MGWVKDGKMGEQRKFFQSMHKKPWKEARIDRLRRLRKRRRVRKKEKLRPKHSRKRIAHPTWTPNKAGRHDYLTRKYGISVDRYDQMWRDQGGLCYICGDPEQARNRRLAVDHDHKTRRVRALLCTGCNRGLGFFRDNPAILEAAAHYLRKMRGHDILGGG